MKQACTARVFAYLAKFSSLSNDLPRHILHNVLMHLKSLRQACNHYQVFYNDFFIMHTRLVIILQIHLLQSIHLL